MGTTGEGWNEEMEGGERSFSAQGGGGIVEIKPGKPFGFCHGCKAGKNFKERHWRNILLSCVRSLPGLYLTDLMCCFHEESVQFSPVW